METVSGNTDMDNFIALCSAGFARGDKAVRLLGVGVRLTPETSSQQDSEAADQLALSLEQVPE